jgi:hypothetical protein
LDEGPGADSLMKIKKKAIKKVKDKRLILFLGVIFLSFPLNLIIRRKEHSFLNDLFLRLLFLVFSFFILDPL